MIVDQYGQQMKYLEGAQKHSRARAFQPSYAKDFDDLISEIDWATVVLASRKLYQNFGIVKGAIEQKSSFCVGNAFLPRFTGTDKEWGKQAQDWLTKWMRICDVRGGVFDFQTDMYLASLGIDRDGDCFAAMVKNEKGYPFMQMIPAHSVGSRDGEKIVSAGKWKGLKITKGVIQNRFGRAMAFKVLGKTADQDRIVDATSILHLYDPAYCDQSRGLPLFSHAVNLFRDMKESHEREQFAQLILSSLVFTEHNETGRPNDDDITSFYGSANGSTETGIASLDYASGQIKHFVANSGGKLEPVETNRPSPNWQAFNDRLERQALVGTGWPLALLEAASGKSVADRIALTLAQKQIVDRQTLLMPFANKIASFAVASAIEMGDLPANSDWYKWTFSTPPHITVDFSKDSQQFRENYLMGVQNMRDFLESIGKNVEDHYTERLEEVALLQKLKEEAEKRHNIKIDMRDVKLMSQNQLNTPTTDENI
jgi:hypothetical protein